jgi:hypothetical protein
MLADLDTATVRKLSVRADVDTRTLRKVLAGLPVKGTCGDRARRILERAGYRVPPAPRWFPPNRRTDNQ